MIRVMPRLFESIASRFSSEQWFLEYPRVLRSSAADSLQRDLNAVRFAHQREVFLRGQGIRQRNEDRRLNTVEITRRDFDDDASRVTARGRRR